jgi:DNA-directed RNA polymerase alpha subunit
VEIINPEHVIAHLSQGGKLDMQIKVEKGRGYVPGNLRRYGDEPTKSIGRIVLDASFLARAPRQLRRGKRPRRAAHRPWTSW